MRICSVFRRLRRSAVAILCCFALFATPVTASPGGSIGENPFAVFTDPVSANGVALLDPGYGDSLFTLTTHQNKPVIAVEKYAYFAVTDPTLLAAEAATMTLTLVDTGENPMSIQYCSTDDPYKTVRVYGSGSGEFITVELTLYDVSFADAAQNFGASFRFQGGTVYSLFLREGAAADAEMTFTDPISTKGGIDIVLSDGVTNDSQFTLTTVEGTPAMQVDKYAYFRVTNSPLLKATELVLTVTLLDEGNSPILFQYCSTDSLYELIHIQRYNTGKFVTVEIPLFEAALGRAAQNHGASFRFYRGTIRSLSLSAGCTDAAEQAPPTFAPQTETNNIIGKGIAGYQVWFRATDEEDGSWSHWGEDGTLPITDNVHTEIYPYTDDYLENGATLYQSGLANLGNGSPSLLYNAPDAEIIETHMQWMQEYNIDGAAVQRFYSATDPMRSTRKNTLMTIQEQAEKYGRIFYVMYDFSYASRTDPESFIRTVQLDFVYNAEDTGVVSSPNYGHADGKPVVCLWGLHGDPASEYFCGETATILIEWFQSRGYYVIGGSPDNSYDEAVGEYLEPFTKLDMLSVWTVGRYNAGSMASWLKTHVEIDLAFCEQYDIDYQPVIFSGFGWTNMNNNGYVNHYPRAAGQFLWDQAYILKHDYDIDTVYFAMWDEYDEGTAIMKGAADYFEIPTDQYFLTWAADGWWLSNDFYLRAAEAVLDMMQGEAPLRKTVDIPHSEGPVYWRNSFESRETTYTLDSGATNIPTVGQLDVCLNNPAWLEKANLTAYTAVITSPIARSGSYAFHFSGTVADGYEAVYKIADTVINASQPLTLSYYLQAVNENGRDVYVDLLFSDGTRLSDTNTAVIKTHDQTGSWIQTTLTLGPAAEGRTIVGVVVGYAGASGYFDAYVDDILLEHSADAHQWDIGLVIQKATALEAGIREYVCQNEGCGVTVDEWYAHDPTTCDHSEAERRAQVDATCTTTGLTAGVWCFICNGYADGGETIPAHTTERRDAIAPTVGVPGLTAGVWCTVCEKYIEGGEEIPALHLPGDINHNDKVDSTDARLTLQYAVNKISASALDLTAADVDGSGKVDSTDARLILQYAVNKITVFPVEVTL